MNKIDFKKLDENTVLPSYETEGSAGFDLTATNVKKLVNAEVDDNGVIYIQPLGRVILGCGFAIALPIGKELQIRPRSGLAAKQSITVLNSPGTIDSDYRGEIGVILVNLSNDRQQISLNTRIAQGVVSNVEQYNFAVKKTLPDTKRGEGGFGSTGK